MRNYKEYYERMGLNIKEKIDFIIPFLSDDNFDIVVDFGCADGRTTRALASLFPNIKNYWL